MRQLINNLIGTKQVGLVEVIQSGQSVFLLDSPVFRYRWLLRLWFTVIEQCESGEARVINERIVTPERAAELMDQYAEWRRVKNQAKSFRQQLASWASTNH